MTRQGIKCLECGTVLVSLHRHDFRGCKLDCSNETFIDGGSDYLRYGGKDLNKIEIVELTQEQIEGLYNG